MNLHRVSTATRVLAGAFVLSASFLVPTPSGAIIAVPTPSLDVAPHGFNLSLTSDGSYDASATGTGFDFTPGSSGLQTIANSPWNVSVQKELQTMAAAGSNSVALVFYLFQPVQHASSGNVYPTSGTLPLPKPAPSPYPATGFPDAMYANKSSSCSTSTASGWGGWSSITPAQLYMAIQDATMAGLSVTLRPSIEAMPTCAAGYGDWGTGQSRANLVPDNPQSWFTNYATALTPYLQAVQSITHKQSSAHIIAFDVATELIYLGNHPQWYQETPAAALSGNGWSDIVIPVIKSYFTGNLIFSDTFASGPTVAGTSPAVDAYPHITATTDTPAVANSGSYSNLGAAPTPSQILAAWYNVAQYQKSIARAYGGYFTETGDFAQTGSLQNPAVYPSPAGAYNPTLQDNFYQAACSYAIQVRASAFYFWIDAVAGGPHTASGFDVNVSNDLLEVQNASFDSSGVFVNAGTTISRCFSALTNGTPFSLTS